MNSKKGQTLPIAIITSLIVLVIGMLVINFMTPEITRTRESLSCSDAASISDGTKLLCLAIDGTVPYWILLVFSGVIGGVTSRFVL